MIIEKAQELGLCFGVKRALKMLEGATSKHREIETLGPIAHNQQLVERLIKIGIKPVNSLSQVQGEVLAVTTHGTNPEVLSEAKARHIHIIDTTCPLVRKTQNTAKELAQAGFSVIIFGEAEHSEVKALLGWAKDKGTAVLDVKQLDRLGRKPYRLGVISQTTQLQPALMGFVGQLVATFGSKAREIRIINTLCGIAQKRQESAVSLAKRSEIMIVVGGYNSANTNRLTEACSHIVETHLVERADEVNHIWFAGKQRIGITAGASTPDETIEEVITKLRSFDTDAVIASEVI